MATILTLRAPADGVARGRYVQLPFTVAVLVLVSNILIREQDTKPIKNGGGGDLRDECRLFPG